MGMRGLRRLVPAFACAVGVAASAAAIASLASAGPKASSAPSASNGSVNGWRVAATIYPPGPHPAKGTRVFMSGLSAPGASDVWAIGGTITASDQSFPVLEHWDGRTWKYMAMPRSFAGVPWVTGVVPGKGPDGLTFVAGAAHWNGTRWTIIPDPAADAHFPQAGDVDELTSATADGRGGLWAVAEGYPPLRGCGPWVPS